MKKKKLANKWNGVELSVPCIKDEKMGFKYVDLITVSLWEQHYRCPAQYLHRDVY